MYLRIVGQQIVGNDLILVVDLLFRQSLGPNQFISGRDEIGLNQVVIVLYPINRGEAAGWTTRAERGNGIVLTLRLFHSVLVAPTVMTDGSLPGEWIRP